MPGVPIWNDPDVVLYHGTAGLRKHAILYDLVSGPVTGDWKKQTVIPDGDQVSFHTDAAVDVLNALPGGRKRRVI